MVRVNATPLPFPGSEQPHIDLCVCRSLLQVLIGAVLTLTRLELVLAAPLAVALAVAGAAAAVMVVCSSTSSRSSSCRSSSRNSSEQRQQE